MRTPILKRAVLAAVGVGLAVAAAGCGSSSGAPSTTAATGTTATSSGSTTPSAATLKVAVVAPSATNDLAFTESMYSALESMKSSAHLQISISQNEFVVSDAAAILRQYAQEGYNLVIAHGSQYGSIIQQLAPQFPKVSFAWGTAGATFGLPNVFAYEASSNEGGYVQGYMAEMMSKSKTLGVIGPIATGDAKLYVDGFVAGAKAAAAAAKTSATVNPVYTGSFSDDSLMATAAKTFISNGADVLTGSSQSVVGAIGVARADGKPWFGTQWTQATLAPKNVVSSQVYNWVPVLSAIFNDIRSGKLGDATFVIGLGNGGEKIQFNPSYNLPNYPLTA
ncbi:MAG: BMP family ABC transporter substrate-binding protein, partial [Actinomycetota bacterium]|nr:BMP family ABC transporter substrate-binding protein [Actinomycetota bacterium]